VSPGVQLPEVTVEYDNINVEADALVGSASIPSLSNVALGILKVSTGLQATRGTTVMFLPVELFELLVPVLDTTCNIALKPSVGAALHRPWWPED